MAATAPILEFDDAVDEILANADTPAVVRERLAFIAAHDAKAEAIRVSNIREADKIREERGNIARLRATIERDDARVGPLKRERTNEKGVVELVPVDRLTPLAAKDAALRTRLNEVSTAHIPPMIGKPVREWLVKQRSRTLFAADPVTPDTKKGESITDAYERRQETTNAKLAKISAIWDTQRPLADVLAQIPGAVDRIAHAPRLGEFFAGSHTSAHRGRRTIEYPNPKILFEQERVRQDFGENFGVVTSAAALVAWLCRDELIEKLSDLARARATDTKALSIEAKRAALDSALCRIGSGIADRSRNGIRRRRTDRRHSRFPARSPRPSSWDSSPIRRPSPNGMTAKSCCVRSGACPACTLQRRRGGFHGPPRRPEFEDDIDASTSTNGVRPMTNTEQESARAALRQVREKCGPDALATLLKSFDAIDFKTIASADYPRVIEAAKKSVKASGKPFR